MLTLKGVRVSSSGEVARGAHQVDESLHMLHARFFSISETDESKARRILGQHGVELIPRSHVAPSSLDLSSCAHRAPASAAGPDGAPSTAWGNPEGAALLYDAHSKIVSTGRASLFFNQQRMVLLPKGA